MATKKRNSMYYLGSDKLELLVSSSYSRAAIIDALEESKPPAQAHVIVASATFRPIDPCADSSSGGWLSCHTPSLLVSHNPASAGVVPRLGVAAHRYIKAIEESNYETVSDGPEFAGLWCKQNEREREPTARPSWPSNIPPTAWRKRRARVGMAWPVLGCRSAVVELARNSVRQTLPEKGATTHQHPYYSGP